MWTDKQFQAVKTALKSPSLLVHYNCCFPLVLSCDTLPYRDNLEKPIAFASRSLAAAENNYSQLDKETLAVLFGVKKSVCTQIYNPNGPQTTYTVT